jgi:hypothetical protein
MRRVINPTIKPAGLMSGVIRIAYKVNARIAACEQELASADARWMHILDVIYSGLLVFMELWNCGTVELWNRGTEELRD